MQEVLHRLLGEAGRGPVAGHKIGCTTPVMQAFLGIPNPCAGGVLAAAVHERAAHVRHADYVRAGVECEIAVRLGADLPATGAPFDRARVAPAVAACHAAMEIVDDRYVDYRTLGVPTLIADDFFSAGCVLGPAVTGWRDLDLAALDGRDPARRGARLDAGRVGPSWATPGGAGLAGEPARAGRPRAPRRGVRASRKRCRDPVGDAR